MIGAEYRRILDITDPLLEADYLIPLLKAMKLGKKIKVETWNRRLENTYSKSSASILRTSNSLEDLLARMYRLTLEVYILKDFTEGKVDESIYRINSQQISDLNIVVELSDIWMKCVEVYQNVDIEFPSLLTQEIQELEITFLRLYRQLQLEKYQYNQEDHRSRIIEEIIKRHQN